MTATDPGSPRRDPRDLDPWEHESRLVLARSILGHTDETNWRQQVERALLALGGATIDEIRKVAS